MMTANIMNNLSRLMQKTWTPEIQIVRFRFWKDMQGKRHLVRRRGYKDDFFPRGLLAHSDKEDRIKAMPLFRPKDSWNEKRSLFGQNDYIDILGDGNIHPTKLLYDVPMWIRGEAGNEYQLLLKKRKALEHGDFPYTRPKKWKEINTRIDWLYKYLNTKQRYGMPLE